MSIIVALLVSVIGANAQIAYFDSLNMRYVGSWPFGPANDIAVDSVRNIVFMTSGGGILIFSMDSTPPYLLSSMKFRYKVLSLMYDRYQQRLFAGFGGYGLGIFDVSDPSNPRIIACSGVQNDNTSLFKMKIYGNYLVASGICCGSAPVLAFYDLNNMSNLFFYGYPLRNGAGGFDIADHYVFVAEGSGGIEVIDIQRLARPSTISYYSDGRRMTNLQISGNYAYVVEGTNGVAIVNISNPHSLQPVGQVFFNGMEEALSIYKKDSLLYITDPWGSLWIANVTNPYSPALVSRVQNLGTPWKIIVYDTLAYMLGRFENGTFLLNVSNPSSVSIIKNTGGFYYSNRLTLSGNTALLSYGESGTFLIDVSNPTDPQFISHIDGNIYYAVEDLPLVFVAKNDTGLAIYDISDPRNPQMLSSIDTLLIYKIIPRDTVIYAFKEPYTLLKIDVTNPANPVIVAQSNFYGGIVDFAITDSDAVILTGDYLYVARLEDLHETYITGILVNSLGGVAIQDSFVYVVKDMNPGIVKYRLLNDSLFYVTSMDSSFSSGARAALSGQYLYVGNFYDGVKVFDISDYFNIHEVAYYSGYMVLDIAASNGHAYISTGDMGLQIFELAGVGVNEGYNRVLPTHFLISHRKKVRLMLPINEGGELEVYNTSGRKVYSRNIQGGAFEIDLPKDGLYLWKYEVNGRILNRGKILVVN